MLIIKAKNDGSETNLGVPKVLPNGRAGEMFSANNPTSVLKSGCINGDNLNSFGAE